MIAATRRWFRRNRANFVIGAGVIGAGYLAGQYVLGRIQEARQRMTDDRASKENLRRRFELNQEDCTYTVLALLPTIRDEIIGALPVEQITEQLQQERQERLKRLAASEAPSSEYPSAPPSIVDDASTASFVHASQLVEDRPKRSKAQLWQDMKINSIARALSLLYITALLTLLTRIQLNLLGRRRYLSSVVSMASPPPTQASTISLEDHDISFETIYGNDFETNRMYLTFSWWLLHRGAKRILERVMVAVKDVFGQVNIREDMTLERLSELIIEVRKRVEGATEEERRTRSWLEFLLPPQDQELFVINQAAQSDGSDSASPEPAQNPMDVDTVTPSLRRLLDETADLTDSPTFAMVLSHLLDAGFSHLIDVRVASEAFKVNVSGDRITEIVDTKCKLAHILPIFCRQAHAIVVGSGELDAIAGVAGNEAVPNEYLALMDRVHDLEAFAAVIYSSNFEYEVVDSADPSAQPLTRTSDGIQLVDQTKAFMEQARDAVAPRLEQARDAVAPRLEQTRAAIETKTEQARVMIAPRLEQARDFAATSAQQTRDVLATTLEHAQNFVAAEAKHARDTIEQDAQQTRETTAAQAQRARETIAPKLEQTQNAVATQTQQIRETARSQAQQAQQAMEATAQQTQQAISSTIEQARDVVQPKVEQARDVVQPKVEQAQASAGQGIQQVREAIPSAEQVKHVAAQNISRTRDAVASAPKQAEQIVKQTATSLSQSLQPAPQSAVEKAVESNVLESSGPDLTKSIVPVDEPTTSLSESAVVVEEHPISQSTVVVDTPSMSTSLADFPKPPTSAGRVGGDSAARPPPTDFETAWANATKTDASAKVTKNKKPGV